MMQGLVTPEVWDGHPIPPGYCNTYDSSLEAAVVFEDEEIVVACKPSGMPSVPGLDGRESLQEWLEKKLQIPVISVHRLDMDTSGIIVFAKNSHAEICLKKQFEEHTVNKTYLAKLSPADTHRFVGDIPLLKAGDKGIIGLYLGPDYDERPRQKVDPTQGKESLTEYEVTTVNEDGTTDILFYPHTGRTHQLRVHSAHLNGLGRPILGDLLYGGSGTVWSGTSECSGNLLCPRLCLHAHSITFRHPATGSPVTFSI
jgi:tRNA pseudouridine32 synthase/23S rRNA pseudouridine746 synthase